MPRVAVLCTEDPYDVYQLLELIDAQRLFDKEEQILLKPNCVKPVPHVNTDARVVEGVIAYLESNGLDNLIVGDGGIAAYDTWETFRLTGLDASVRGHPLVDLNRDQRIPIDFGGSLGQIGVARTFLEAGAIVSIPRIKVHSLSRSTVGMKNMMGGILPKSIFHNNIHEKIVDLNRLFRPRLTVVDGLVGLEGHETGGDPVKHGVLVAGRDVVAVDSICSHMMGIPPPRYLRLAAEAGLGICDLNEIEIIGDDPPVKKYRF